MLTYQIKSIQISNIDDFTVEVRLSLSKLLFFNVYVANFLLNTIPFRAVSKNLG